MPYTLPEGPITGAYRPPPVQGTRTTGNMVLRSKVTSSFSLATNRCVHEAAAEAIDPPFNCDCNVTLVPVRLIPDPTPLTTDINQLRAITTSRPSNSWVGVAVISPSEQRTSLVIIISMVNAIPFDMPPFTGAESPLAETLMNV
jgi:hypothetical protein